MGAGRDREAPVVVKGNLSLDHLFGSTSSPGTRHLSAFPSCTSSALLTKSNTCYIRMKTNDKDMTSRSYLKGPCHLKSPSFCVTPQCSQTSRFLQFPLESTQAACTRVGGASGRDGAPPTLLHAPSEGLLLSILGAPELSFSTQFFPRVSEVALHPTCLCSGERTIVISHPPGFLY